MWSYVVGWVVFRRFERSYCPHFKRETVSRLISIRNSPAPDRIFLVHQFNIILQIVPWIARCSVRFPSQNNAHVSYFGTCALYKLTSTEQAWLWKEGKDPCLRVSNRRYVLGLRKCMKNQRRAENSEYVLFALSATQFKILRFQIAS